MTETETEAATIERLELALKRIGELARQPRPEISTAAPGLPAGLGPEINKAALAHALDLMISRLRNGLALPKPAVAE